MWYDLIRLWYSSMWTVLLRIMVVTNGSCDVWLSLCLRQTQDDTRPTDLHRMYKFVNSHEHSFITMLTPTPICVHLEHKVWNLHWRSGLDERDKKNNERIKLTNVGWTSFGEQTMKEWTNFNGSLYYVLRKYILHAQYNQFSTAFLRGVCCITCVSSGVRRVDRIDDQCRTPCSVLARIHRFIDFCKSDFSVFNNRSIWFQQVPQPPNGWTFIRDALKINHRSTDHSGVHRTNHTWHTLS